MATNISAIRDVIKDHVEDQLPRVFDDIFYFDPEPLVAVEMGLLGRSETILLVQYELGESDNLTGSRRTRAVFHNFRLTVLTTTGGRAGLNDAVKAIDDLANSLHTKMQPNLFVVTTLIEDGAHVEVLDIEPVTRATLDFAGHAIPIRIRIPT